MLGLLDVEYLLWWAIHMQKQPFSTSFEQMGTECLEISSPRSHKTHSLKAAGEEKSRENE